MCETENVENHVSKITLWCKITNISPGRSYVRMACTDALLREYVKNVGAVDSTDASVNESTGLSPLLAKFFADNGGFNSYIHKDNTQPQEVSFVCIASTRLQFAWVLILNTIDS